MVLDSVRALVFPLPERISHFLSVAQCFLEDRAPIVSLLGHLASLERLVPGSKVRSRSLQWCLKKHWKAVSDPPWWWVPPSHLCLADLSWWMEPGSCRDGAMQWQMSSVVTVWGRSGLYIQ
ncbi:hypothetical protein E2C01_068120 [Portunus trituberculatus]|uniref:Uncharacterized protein n=1 Tax=Portunus trituberculatus TaxID=210409 RepID=A0A5B7HUY4_PORTR|nr:hypothetical protein [Portunus trituberculatus]